MTNESEYRAWREKNNGVKKRANGFFGVVNLLGPRSTSMTPLNRLWNSYFTFVQLRFEFVDGRTRDPLALERTYMSFYDFDTAAGGQAGIEALQMGPQATGVELPSDSWIIREADWPDFVAGDDLESSARAKVTSSTTTTIGDGAVEDGHIGKG